MAAETSYVVVSAVLVLWRLILVEFCISMWVCTGVCVHGWRCHWSPKEGIWSPGASGTGGCELLRMGAGDRTWFPCKNPRYHLSSPCPHYLCCSSNFPSPLSLFAKDQLCISQLELSFLLLEDCCFHLVMRYTQEHLTRSGGFLKLPSENQCLGQEFDNVLLNVRYTFC